VSHYQTLGVDKTATQAEIKKAYRKLSMQHHPDKGGDTKRFQEIADAYNIVGDETKRQQYDTMQSNPFANFGNMGGMDGNFGDLFNQMFGQQRQQSKGNDLRVQMHISFSEAFYGCTKVFNIDGRPITLGIRPGAKSNQKLILRGQGQAHPFNSQLPNGDIIVELSVELNSENIIDPQNNIWRDISMPWYDIMIGGKVSISTIDGAVSINIPKNTKPGKVLRLKERGWPDYNTGVRGNLMVKLIPTYPDLNDEQLEYIKKVQIK